MHSSTLLLRGLSATLSATLVILSSAHAQPGQRQARGFPADDPVIRQIRTLAIDSSSLPLLAHQLLDVIGPRLVGTPGMLKANTWGVNTLTGWGIEARNEQYGTWRGWERGPTHIDLISPRVRTLEGTILAWSPGTRKGGITAGVIILPALPDSAAVQQWLPSVKGKFVLISQPQPTGRPDKNWEEFATPESFDTLKALRERIRFDWETRIKATGFKPDTLPCILENAGAAGVLSSTWASGWGANRIFGTKAKKAPVVDLGLEDYNLIYRLAANGDAPLLRIEAESRSLDPQPAFNTIGMIRGTAQPEEFVILSAHFDSWDGASGATDNGTGSLQMLEAMRILKKVLPHPRRTILIGLWGSEEQGLNGSRAFVKDHPEIVKNIQALFNQDNGTGRISSMSASGFINAAGHLGRWLSRVPSEVTQNIKFSFPGMPAGGGTDHASFDAAGAPGFGLGSNSWDYFAYTWHTNRDTYDKLVFDELENNVDLIATLAYCASEDPERVPLERRALPDDRRTGKPMQWPEIADPVRK